MDCPNERDKDPAKEQVPGGKNELLQSSSDLDPKCDVKQEELVIKEEQMSDEENKFVECGLMVDSNHAIQEEVIIKNEKEADLDYLIENGPVENEEDPLEFSTADVQSKIKSENESVHFEAQNLHNKREMLDSDKFNGRYDYIRIDGSDKLNVKSEKVPQIPSIESQDVIDGDISAGQSSVDLALLNSSGYEDLNIDKKIYMNSGVSFSSLFNDTSDVTGDIFTCNVCMKSFSQLRYLNRHYKIHSGDRPFKCDHCDKSFCLFSTLKIHLRVHTGEKPFSCDICTKSFSHLSSLKGHLVTHSTEKPFMCNICPKSYRQVRSLKSHLLFHNTRPFSCDICKKSFADLDDLNDHKITHTKKRFNCNECEKSFIKLNRLNEHVRDVHTGLRPFTCFVCRKSFKTTGTLDHHVKVMHMNAPKEALFTCDLCQDTFIRENDLKCHILRHTGVKIFNCCLCNTSFHKLRTLETHVRLTHPFYNSFSCSVC